MHCAGHTPHLSGLFDYDSELGFISLLVVNGRNEGVVVLNLPNGPLKTCPVFDMLLNKKSKCLLTVTNNIRKKDKTVMINCINKIK